MHNKRIKFTKVFIIFSKWIRKEYI